MGITGERGDCEATERTKTGITAQRMERYKMEDLRANDRDPLDEVAPHPLSPRVCDIHDPVDCEFASNIVHNNTASM